MKDPSTKDRNQHRINSTCVNRQSDAVNALDEAINKKTTETIVGFQPGPLQLIPHSFWLMLLIMSSLSDEHRRVSGEKSVSEWCGGACRLRVRTLFFALRRLFAS
jgi:hypothetical protein